MENTINTLEVLDKGFTLVDYNGCQVIMKAGRIVSKEDYQLEIQGKKKNGFSWESLDSRELGDILDSDIQLIKLTDKNNTNAYGTTNRLTVLHIDEKKLEDSFILGINTGDNFEQQGSIRFVLGVGDIAYQLHNFRPELYDDFIENQLKLIGLTVEQYNNLPYKEFKGYNYFKEWIYKGHYYKITKKGDVLYSIKKLDSVVKEQTVGSVNTKEPQNNVVRAQFI